MGGDTKAEASASRRRRKTPRGDTPFDRLVRKAQESGSLLRLTGLRGSANRVAACHLIRAHGERPVLYVTAHSRAADAAALALQGMLGERPDQTRIRHFPRHDSLPFDRFSPQPFVVGQRMEVLHRLDQYQQGQAETAPIIVAPLAALALHVPSRAQLRAATLRITIGDSLDRDEISARLIGRGYQRMPLVEESGEIAVRGDIIDLFPPQLDKPVRIELWGDEVDSIRSFDPASQRSQAKLSSVLLPPPRELIFDRDGIVERSQAIRAKAAEQKIAPSKIDALIDSLLRGHLPPGAESLAPLIQPDCERFFDYLDEDVLILIEEPEEATTRLAEIFDEISANFESSQGERLTVPISSLLMSPGEITSALEDRPAIRIERLDVAFSKDEPGRHPIETQTQDELRRALAVHRSHERALSPLADQCRAWLADGWRVIIACNSLSTADRIRSLLSEYELEGSIATDPRPVWHWSLPGRLEFRVLDLAEGFVWPGQALAVLTDEEIFGVRERSRNQRSWRDGQKLDGIAQLAPGDFLVHADHGIGIYRGLMELRAGGQSSELLAIEYLGADKLFLPVDRLSRVQRYGAADGVKPRIDKLGGETWERTKGKVKASLRNMAGELLALHAARELAPGFSFSERDTQFEEFEAGFAYTETPDQMSAIDDVLGDMHSPKPMDRLVCGDVGYGKTEIA
ncbi:MAG: CarD family transcriptional regulator, partial [Myxococcota bacterium]